MMRRGPAVLWAISIIICDVGAQFDYCSLTRQHTLCRYKGVSRRCGQQRSFDLDASQIDTILTEHNRLRSRVANGAETRGGAGRPQPSASNMLQMVWDPELAEIAQRHADQCRFGHDCIECRTVERFGVGQNVYELSSSRLTQEYHIQDAILAWYDEVVQFNPGQLQPFRYSLPTGHYTQMLWADTYTVGCGYSRYRGGLGINWLFVCNYGPAGNVQGTAMYRAGSPCSRCPAACSTQFPGLCVGDSGDQPFSANSGFPSRDNRPGDVSMTPSSSLQGLAPPEYDGLTGNVVLFHCDFERRGCRLKYEGSVWRVVSTRTQGSVIGTLLRQGGSTSMTFDNLVVPPADGKLCIRYSYAKFQRAGSSTIDLQMVLLSSSGDLLASKTTRRDAESSMRRVSLNVNAGSPFRVAFRAHVPVWARGQVTALAIDGVKLTSGSCQDSRI